MIFIVSISYAISIFIDVSTYHLKYYIQDSKNVRYLLSLINIFQYSARAFVLIFIPMMAYYTETIKDKNLVWEITIIAHIFVVLLLLPLYSYSFSSAFSKRAVLILNKVFGKSKKINLLKLEKPDSVALKLNKNVLIENFTFFSITFIAGFLFSISITFLYYLSFSFPQKALTLSSFTQVLNMFGSLIFILLVDPKIMSSIDHGQGHQEIKLLTTSRIFVHLTLIIVLILIK